MVTAIVGANWGDEGKGKITDMLGEESDIIVRFQGGSNAGHTIINDYGKFALHLLPSGVFYDHTTSIIGNGVALNIPYLFNEINELTKRGVPQPKILVSDRAQILMPYHIAFDEYEEEHHFIQINTQRLVFRYQNFSRMMMHLKKRLRESAYRKMLYLNIYTTNLNLIRQKS